MKPQRHMYCTFAKLQAAVTTAAHLGAEGSLIALSSLSCVAFGGLFGLKASYVASNNPCILMHDRDMRIQCTMPRAMLHVADHDSDRSQRNARPPVDRGWLVMSLCLFNVIVHPQISLCSDRKSKCYTEGTALLLV